MQCFHIPLRNTYAMVMCDQVTWARGIVVFRLSLDVCDTCERFRKVCSQCNTVVHVMEDVLHLPKYRTHNYVIHKAWYSQWFLVNNHPIPKLEPKENDGYCKLSPLWLVFVVISKTRRRYYYYLHTSKRHTEHKTQVVTCKTHSSYAPETMLTDTSHGDANNLLTTCC